VETEPVRYELMNLKFDPWRTKVVRKPRVLAANVLSNAWILLWLILCTGGRARASYNSEVC
jgi:hypothetical protein